MPNTRTVFSHIFLFVLLFLAGCGGGGTSNSNSSNNIIDNFESLKLPPTPTIGLAIKSSASNQVLIAGGTVSLENVAVVTFPANSIPDNTNVVTYTSSDTKIAEDFDVATLLYDVNLRQPHEIRINVGVSQPTAMINASINIPAELSNEIDKGFDIQAFGRMELDDEIVGFSPITSTYDSVSKVLNVELPNSLFSQNNSNDGTFEAIIVIALIDSSAQQSLSKGVLSITPAPPGPVIEGLNSPLKEKLVVTSGFDMERLHPTLKVIRPHVGIDLKAPLGTEVFAAYDGVLTWGYQKEGFGLFAVITHKDKSKTVYAHLSKLALPSSPVTVKKGQKIGEAGVSGGISTAAHLHFEFNKYGYLKSKGKFVYPYGYADPWPLIQRANAISTVEDAITLQVNEKYLLKLQDLNGHTINIDSNGNPLRLEDVKWESNNPQVVAIDEKGVISVIEIGTATITALQTSSGITNEYKVEMGQFWEGSYTYTKCTVPPDYVGLLPCAYVLVSLAYGPSYGGPLGLYARTGTNEENNIRIDHDWSGAEWCQAQSGIDLGKINSWNINFPNNNTYTVSLVPLTFTVTNRSSSLISGVFAGSFEVFVQGDEVVPGNIGGIGTGQIEGVWSLHPRSKSFPKCLTNGAEFCVAGDYAYNATTRSIGDKGSCDWQDASIMYGGINYSQGRPGEWSGLP